MLIVWIHLCGGRSMADMKGSQAMIVGVVLSCFVRTVTGVRPLETFYLTDFCNHGRFSIKDYKANGFILQLTRKANYSPNMTCEMDIIATPGYRLLFVFMKIDFHDCKDHAYLSEYRNGAYHGLNPEICDKIPSPHPVTSGEHGLIGFSSDNEGEGPGFKVIISDFYTASTCTKPEYQCKNDRCIDRYLLCSGYDNCGDNSNNGNFCENFDGGLAAGEAILGVISIFVLIGIGLACRRRR